MNFVKKELLQPIDVIKDQMISLSKGNLSNEFLLEEDDTEIGSLTGAIKSTKTYLQGVIGDLSHIMAALSLGDLTFSLNAEYIGEFSEIKQSLENFREKICTSFYMIQETSQKVAEGAGQIASSSQHLAENCSQEALAADTLNTTMKDFHTNVKETATKAETSQKLAKDAGNELLLSSQKLKELNESMDIIMDCSKQISQITSAIDEIAVQTNLLSLNASIEAARAGDAGKGFAVVAGEVKSLANDSSSSVEKTEVLVSQTLQAIETGIRLAQETVTALKHVEQLSENSILSMESVSVANQEQAQRIDSVMRTLTQISSSIQSNSAASEETAAISDEQNKQSEQLKELLAQFKLS